MSYVIEDGIPIPERIYAPSPAGARTEWTRILSLLDVGQSVMTTESKDCKAAEQYASRSRPKRFAIRKVDREGWRVWRVK